MFKKKSSVGIIYTGDEKIIMGKRKDTRAWTFIGGGKEMFETPKACIIREIREEIGINVLNVSFIEKAETPKAIVYIYNVFLTEHSDGLNFTVLADPDQEFSEIKCFKREEIKDLYLHFPLEDNVVTKVLRLSPQIKTDSLADSPIDSLADKAREIQKVQLDAVSVEELDMGIVEKIKAEKSLANKARLI
ncbi:MAG TPA: NUDIX hydrolase, partial [Sulfurimonas sp.]|nr:NUDIX hydrolase [Sulfurimonas sp.]